MAIESLGILVATGEGNAYLAEQYGKVIDNVQTGCISTIFKNTDLSGDPSAGSVIARRLANTELNDYGTARAGGGQKVKADNVTINIDQKKELIVEVEESDARMFGVEGLVERKMANVQLRLIKNLEKDFWREAVKSGAEFTTTADTTGAQIDEAIVALETTKNQYVDGVPRELMGVVVSPSVYTGLQKDIDLIRNHNNDNTYELYHKVPIHSSTDLPDGVQFIVLVKGAIAQPIHYSPDEAGKFPASNAYHFGMFAFYGTKAVSPELIKVVKASA